MNTTTSIRTLIATALVSALASSVAAVSAADNSDVPQAVVKFGDLNISNPQDAAKLYSRIAAAAYALCRPFDIDNRNLGAQARLKACVHKAIADAVTRVGQPELIAIYNAKNPRRKTISLSRPSLPLPRLASDL